MTSTADSYATLSTESLRSNCDVYQKVHECSIGCQMGVDSQSCSSNCYDLCADGDESFLPESGCPVNCSRELCSLGCSQYTKLESFSSIEKVPSNSSYSFTVKPHSAPHFHSEATYDIVLLQSPFQTNNDQMAVTSFVIRVSTDELTTHYWLPSFKTPLVLDKYLACKSVDIQILPVNKYGRAANYSDNVTVLAYGEEVWPHWPDHPRPYRAEFSVSDDVREDYWEHGVVHVSWDEPNRVQYLEDYTLEIASTDEFKCGKSVTTNIDKPSYIWAAETPADGPINGCTYKIKILSNPHNSTYPGPQEQLSLSIETVNNTIPNDLMAEVNTSCYLRKGEGMFVYFIPTMEFSLPLNPVLLQGIEGFKLVLNVLTKNSNEFEFLDLEQFNLSQQRSRSQVVKFNSSYRELFQELQVVHKSNVTLFINTSFSCHYRLTAPPPVTSITANDVYIDQTTASLHVDVVWEDPVTHLTNAEVSNYNIYVGQALQSNFSIPDSPNGFIFRYKTTSINRMDEVIQLTDLASANDKDWYIQVQPISIIGFEGVWSEPLVFSPRTSKFHINLDINCDRVVQAILGHQIFSLSIQWTVNSPKANGLKYFEVDLKGVRKDGTATPIATRAVNYDNLRSTYSHVFENRYISPSTKIDYYEIKVKSFFKQGYPDRSAVVPQFCTLDGRPQGPSSIGATTLHEFSIDSHGRLNMSLSWVEPKETYGGIREYWVYVGPEELSGTVLPDDYVLLVNDLYSFHSQVRLPIGESIQSQFGNETDEWELFIQVLPINNLGVASNWSAPQLVTIEAMEFDFSIFTTTTTMITATSTITSSSTYYYYYSSSLAPPVASKEAEKPVVDAYHRLVPVLSAIIPVVFVLLLAIVLVLVLLVVAYCQRKKMASVKEESKPFTINVGSMSSGYSWEKYPSDIQKLSLIGEGTFGEVHRGLLQQLPDMKRKKYDESVTVFIASLKVSSSEDERFGFARLLEKYKALSSIDHPFFLSFQGYVTCSQPCYLITEFAENGDLLGFLQNHKKKLLEGASPNTDKVLQRFQHQHPTNESLYPVDLLNYARQIASAMDCLAGLGIAHSDLACRNIYVDQNFNIKVADFGIVAKGHREMVYVEGLPLRWSSPEVLSNRSYSIASDVWSFGVTVWEIVTLGEFPYQDVRNEDLLKVLADGKRLLKPENCSFKFFSILSVCWEANPRQRPSFESLHETFLNLLSKSEASSLLTIEQPHPLLEGKTSPSSDGSADSAIIDDLGVVIKTKQSSTSPSCDPALPNYMKRKGFPNPGFRRSSMKSINLDCPSLQVSQTTMLPTATLSSTGISIVEEDEATPASSFGGTDTSTEV